MPISIPIEIIYLFIEASRDWMPTLLQFALVSKKCMVESRKYAFERVKLGQRLPSPDFNCRQIKELHALMTANIALGTYIRHLDIGMDFFRCLCIDRNLGTQELPTILLRLPALASLSFSSGRGCPPCRCDWTLWPSPLKASIERCCSSPMITTLHFADFINFPHGLLTLSPNLKVLSLERIAGVAESPGELQRPVTQSLKALSIAGGWPVVASCVLVAPQSFSSITKLDWHISKQEDISALGRVAREIPRSLQELSIQLSFEVKFVPSVEGSLGRLPQVKKLVLTSDDILVGFPADNIQLPPDLFLAGELLQSQRELEDFIFKSTVWPQIDTTRCAIPTDIQPRSDGWKSLEELLSGLRKPPTITFHFTACWITLPHNQSTFYVPHDLKAAFKERLMQGVHNALCQSMEAGAVTIVLDEIARREELSKLRR
ncbi:hypothetical protein DFP72DRAFT_1168381 [Ephemerocybe angulata]|uniref:Uncharacterized protein n=1 Tax=Ephemerocybe angulata TaxID=980116 RepID=A0A8H6MAI4_9AGAR|nr:hypothetical protein DFP72DRAFT_1168381 [Tulosesus angulatus]